MPTYFIKLAGGNGSGLSDADAWSYQKLNSSSLLPGDIVLLKKGETYHGVLNVSSGVSTLPITYSSYGQGKSPVISGFVEPDTWSLYAEHIYYTTLTISDLSMVTLDGIVKNMGRYPKQGYLPYVWHYQNAYIGGESIATLPKDFNGAEVVVKKYRYIIDRHPGIIISKNLDNAYDSSIQYESGFNLEYYGYNSTYEPTDKNGFFIQNHINCLTEDGDWYYDRDAKRLYVYFKDTADGRLVNAVGVQKVIEASDKSYFNLSDIDFDGGDYGVYGAGMSHVNITNCSFEHQGMNSIYGLHSSFVTIDGVSIKEGNNNGIFGEYQCDYWTAINCTVDNIGEIAGMSKSGDGAAMGIEINGSNSVIKRNKVNNIGYCAIYFDGDDAEINENLVSNFNTVKDDGAGIYTYSSLRAKIRNNIVLDAIGTIEGAGWDEGAQYGKAAGIYLDNGVASHNALVTDNFVANGPYAGIFINNNGSNTIYNNIVYNHKWQLFIADYTASSVRNLDIQFNQFIAKTIDQKCFYFELGTTDTISLVGIINNNIYARPIADTKTMTLFKKQQNTEFDYTLNQWQDKFSIDYNSDTSSINTNNINKIVIYYNNTNNYIEVQLENVYYDILGSKYTNNIIIAPYSGQILIKYNDIILLKDNKILTLNNKVLSKKQLI